MSPTSIQDVKTKKFWAAVFAEFLGTLLLVLVACGSVYHLDSGEIPITHLEAISLCFGFSIATIVWIIGHTSGGHINPAVTTAMLIGRRISLLRGILYVLAQCGGAVVGAGLLKAIKHQHTNLGATTLAREGINVGQGLLIELVITAVLVLTVFAACDSQRGDLGGSAPLSIGLSIAMCHFFAVPFTGSSMNPARSFGPAVAANKWANHWVYWVGPIAGGVFAALIYDLVLAANATPAKLKAFFKPGFDDADFDCHGKKPVGATNSSELKQCA